MNHPEIAKIGLGNVDMARLKKSIDILVEANNLPRTPAVSEIFTPAFLPPTATTCRRSCSERAAGLRSSRRGSGSAARAETNDDGNDHGSQLKGRVAVITGPAKGMGAAITKAFAAEGARLALIGRDVGGDRAGRRRGEGARRRSHRRAVRSHRCQAMRAGGGGHQRRLRPHRHPGERRGRLGAGRQDRRRDDAGRVRRHRHAQHERLLPHHARRAAHHDGAALRQDRQCRRHLRHARARRPHGLFGLEMGPARHHQELRARGRPVQHQRQLRRARHGRRPALSRQGLRRHGQAPRHHRRGGGRAPRRRLRAQARHRPTPTSPMPACFWPATPRARSPASTFRSTAAGPML